ncbi:MAG: choline-sulfatase [Acidimicrobiia bacterium]
MQRPNILLVMADQLAAQALPVYGHAGVLAPHMLRLAEGGVVFESAYCNSPLCAPSRFSMMSGRLPSRIGAYDNASNFGSDIPTMAHYLRAAGYHTCVSGKMHYVGPDQLHGFEERLTTDIYPADFGWTPNWDNPDFRVDWWYHNMLSVKQAGIAETTNQLDFDDEVGFQAIRKLREYALRADEKPWFLTVAFTHPHDPYAMRKSYWDRYDHDQIDLPKVAEIPYRDKDPHSRRLYDLSAMSEYEITEADVRNARHGYYAAISYVDDWLGRFAETLEAVGMADDTIIVFTADHGDMLGERGLWYKMCFFEWALHVPLIVSSPSRFEPHRVSSLVSLLDLLPTFCDWGQTSLPLAPLDGNSLVPLLEGSSGQGEIVAEYMGEGAIAPMFMIRRGRYKYVTSPPDPPQLFDLESDPDELVNLATDADHTELVASLADEASRRWDTDRIHEQVLASQSARRVITEALMAGDHTAWDHQPFRDASRQFMRNHLDLNEVERSRRFPPAPNPPKAPTGNVVVPRP